MKDEGLNVYIATLPRSGSTLLGMILGSHSKVCHIGESSYWGKIQPENVHCSCGKIGCEFLVRIHQEIIRCEWVKDIYEICSMIDVLEEPGKIYHSLSLPYSNNTRRIDTGELNRKLNFAIDGLNCLAGIFRNVSEKKIIVDNTKAIRIAERIVEQKRKNWKILVLTRDPRGLAYSNKQS